MPAGDMRGVPPEVDLTGESLGGFRLVARVGVDDTGALYEAEGHAGPCSVKVLPAHVTADAAHRARFHREVDVLRSVRHPGLVHVLSAGEERGRCWYAMEPVTAPDLKTRLDRVNALPWPEVECLALQLLEALGAAHEAGLVHGDLRPESVLLAPGGVKLWRFGLSLVPLGPRPPQAPEQRKWGRAVAQSDLYALGHVLYEALTGGGPGSRPLPPNVPRHLRRLLEALLSEPIEGRPDSAASARRLLTSRVRLGPLILGGAMLALALYSLLRVT
ncbi:serine/threonine-protein kinase [Myxococcus sp. Y35]|uniref:serine/threonine-protein kinase n=1 Tax=Pseudomyxococcus flavus TaxID=3115648 RepID=UPI003CED4617